MAVIATIAIGLAACSPGAGTNHGSGGSGTPAPGPISFTLFALAELRGQIEPCGCTTDPLGDLSRTVALVEQARAAGPTVVLDAGSSLYDLSPVPPHRADQEKLKAALISNAYRERLKVAAWGLGPADAGLGPTGAGPARQAINVAADSGFSVEAPKIIEVGGAKVGVFGVVLPGAIPGLTVGDPGAAATAAIADLRKQGAQLVVALVQAPSKREAAAFVRATKGVDVAIAGLGAAAPEPDKIDRRAEQLGDAWLVVPANRGQILARLDITLRPGGAPLVDAIGPAAAQDERARLVKTIADLDAQLAGFAKDPSADPSFVAQKQRELDLAKARDQELAKAPLQAPASGSYFTFQQVTINKKLACDAAIDGAKADYSKAAGLANVKAAAARPAPVAPPGTATYIGVEECDTCHAKEVAFWKTTRHAGAWHTLEESGKQLDYECTSCHVTGWDKPGGATMARTEGTVDVQCETCHGPGSIHAEAEGKEKPKTLVLKPADELCATQCHTPQHSDTFQLQAYLRDVTGPGHGEKFRATLGDGPTGHDLRAAGLAKAGKELGAGCRK
ncbi:MAG: hypothetical protein K8W52_18775 [Deltaproteobacteria bacterium]|nr:hypothetical protein [Deltaproteobacteria bacterium]